MECPVCLEDCSLIPLTCGHKFCKGCVKNWYMKGDTCTCPFCRKNLYFRGMIHVISSWSDEYDEINKDKIFSELFDEITESDFCELPEWKPYIMMEMLKDLDKNFNRYYDQGLAYDIDEEYIIEKNHFPVYPKKEKPIKKWHKTQRNKARFRPMGIKA